jgi:hypothetical protein
MGNYFSAIAATPKYDENRGLWENAEVLKASLDVWLKNPKKRMAALAFFDALEDNATDALNFFPFEEHPHPAITKFAAPIMYGDGAFKGLGVTNIGRQQFDCDSFNVYDVWPTPPFFDIVDMLVGVLTSGDSMTFCIRFGEKEITRENVKAIFDRAMEFLD